jgi:arylsulfatase A-like enzyme
MTNPMRAPLSDLVEGKLAKPEVASKHACEVFADEAIRFLREPQTGPFLCFVPFDGPHDPHIVPPDFPAKYEPSAIPLDANFLPMHPFNNGEMTIRDEKLLPWPRTAEDVQAMNAEYYRYITFLDVQIGRILDALASSPYAQNTLVVFSSDSGVARGSHGLIGKQNLYEHSIRVPLIMAGPGIPADKRSEAMCYLFDVFPTLGKLCGVAGPATSLGEDFGAILKDPALPGRPHLMFAYQKVQRAFTDGRWKLIRYPHINRSQLFDLKTDPLETRDLSGLPDHAVRLAELTALLEKQQALEGDDLPLRSASPVPAEWNPPDKGEGKRSGDRTPPAAS